MAMIDDWAVHDWSDAMAHGKNLAPLAFIAKFPPASVVRGLEYTSSLHACWYTALAIQNLVNALKETDQLDDTVAHNHIRQYLSLLVRSGLCERIALMLSDMPYSTVSKQIVVIATHLIDTLPWCIKELLDANLCDHLLSWYAFYERNEDGTAGKKLISELTATGTRLPTNQQTDLIKPGASIEECCAYAPRFAALCRESARALAAAMARGTAIMRCRQVLTNEFLCFLVDEALNLELDPELPSAFSSFECARGLAALVAPTLDDNLTLDEGSMRKEPSDPGDRIVVFAKLETATQLLSVTPFVEALDTLLDENPNDFLAVVSSHNPLVVDMFGIEEAEQTPSSLVNQIAHRYLTINLLCDIFASAVKYIACDPAKLETILGEAREKMSANLSLIHSGTIFEEKLLSVPNTLYENGSDTDVDDIHMAVKIHFSVVDIETKLIVHDGEGKIVDFYYTAQIQMYAAGLALRAINKELEQKSEDGDINFLALQVKDAANQLFADKKFFAAARTYYKALCLTDDIELRGILYSNTAEAHLKSSCPLRAIASARQAQALGNEKAPKRLERAERMLAQEVAKPIFSNDVFDTTQDLLRQLAPGIYFSDDIDLEAPFDGTKLQPRQSAKTKDPSLVETEDDRKRFLHDRIREKGAPFISMAARQGNVRALKRSLRDGENPNTRSINGDTPLMLACCYGHVECAKLLIQHGACSRTSCASGTTARDYLSIDKFRPYYVREEEEIERIRNELIQIIEDAQEAQGPKEICPPYKEDCVIS